MQAELSSKLSATILLRVHFKSLLLSKQITGMQQYNTSFYKVGSHLLFVAVPV